MDQTKHAHNEQTFRDSQFYADAIRGLSASPKYLQSKYFYDTEGDILFQKIMKSPEYYLTNCELEILSGQTGEIADAILNRFTEFDLVELGAGDALKSSYLLNTLLKRKADFTYMPIDISAHVIQQLEQNLPKKLSGLKLTGLNGEYFPMLKEANRLSKRKKVILLLGANLGNMLPSQAQVFCNELRRNVKEGDILLIGFDLKKHPKTILSAYDDEAGITREFNLNLLKRINRELDGDFNVKAFEHYATYDPQTGSCKSYLISLEKQRVHIGGKPFQFQKDEFIAMEISQKYDVEEVNTMARNAGFESVAYFYDSKNWFLDVLWQCD
ncbi:MAG: L-histidine N(alpha)-methyltransferase [Sphingobacteriaceae bacterium]|jgi:dimethylhistidine N-methyltransferase|nr:L-histidine N(alpha)-methyltransferase [Sphingobacteriaceae bacterium]